MKPFEEQLNAVIVDTYRSILKVEETILKRSDKIDLTINEMHLIESVGKGKNNKEPFRKLRRIWESPCHRLQWESIS